MNKCTMLFCAIFTTAALAMSCGGSGDSRQAAYQAELDAMVSTQWSEYSSDKLNWGGGTALFISSPRGDYFTHTGMNDAVTGQYHFRGASTTKTFTAAAILWLHQQGLLNIDDVIIGNIPGTSIPYTPDNANYNLPYKDRITIRLLLQHRAGVFDVSNDPIPSDVPAPYAGEYYISYVRETLGQDDHTFTFDELIGVAALHQLSYFPPGEAFHYSNTGYSILGKIIERVSGQSYADFVRDHFSLPVGLGDTSFPNLGNDMVIPSPHMEGYLWYGQELYDVTQDNMSPHVAEGNVITTPYDLTRWARMLLSGRAGLTEETAGMMMDVQPTGESHGYYGLGCTYTPGLGYGHNGGHIGYMTVMRYDPQYDVTIVIVNTVLNAEDLQGELDFMYGLGLEARKILLYPVE